MNKNISSIYCDQSCRLSSSVSDDKLQTTLESHDGTAVSVRCRAVCTRLKEAGLVLPMGIDFVGVTIDLPGEKNVAHAADISDPANVKYNKL